jgi:hypothetical protein
LKDLCIFLPGLNLLLLSNGCPYVFYDCSKKKRQAKRNYQQLLTPSQPEHPITIGHRIALSCGGRIPNAITPQLLVDGVDPEVPEEPATLSEPEPLLAPSPLEDPVSFGFSAADFASSLLVVGPLSFLALS